MVEPDGQLVMSLGNSRRLPQPLIAGRTIETGRTGPGIIFFDGKGWEVGGLIYRTGAPGGPIEAGAHLSFDQYRNDQVVVLSYADEGTSPPATRASTSSTPPAPSSSACRGQPLPGRPSAEFG